MIEPGDIALVMRRFEFPDCPRWGCSAEVSITCPLCGGVIPTHFPVRTLTPETRDETLRLAVEAANNAEREPCVHCKLRANP